MQFDKGSPSGVAEVTRACRRYCLSEKRFIAGRGKRKVRYSDNGSNFKAASTWLKKVEKDERLNSNLADLSSRWIFNLSCAPSWGGQFEHLIGLFKRVLYKTIRSGSLKSEELEEVVIDVKTALKRLPVLIPYSMVFLNNNNVPELDPHCIEEVDLRRIVRFLKQCKEAMW